jgi:hypothetical protein
VILSQFEVKVVGIREFSNAEPEDLEPVFIPVPVQIIV